MEDRSLLAYTAHDLPRLGLQAAKTKQHQHLASLRQASSAQASGSRFLFVAMPVLVRRRGTIYIYIYIPQQRYASGPCKVLVAAARDEDEEEAGSSLVCGNFQWCMALTDGLD